MELLKTKGSTYLMKRIIGILIFTLLPFTASAGLITFNLAGNSGDGAEGAALDGLESGSVTKGGVTATLSSTFTPGAGDLLLNQTASSFGINQVGNSCDVSSLIDDNCGGQKIFFGFDRFVELVSITLSHYGSNDLASLAFESDLSLEIDIPVSPSTILVGQVVGGLGDRFAIVAKNNNTDEINSFSIDSFTIRTIEVPEPSTLIIFGLGLIALAARRLQK